MKYLLPIAAVATLIVMLTALYAIYAMDHSGSRIDDDLNKIAEDQSP